MKSGSVVVKTNRTMELVDITDIVPTICDVAGIETIVSRSDPRADGASGSSVTLVDGVSFKPYLDGDTTPLREWVYAPLGTKRVLRTKRWLLENNSPSDFGQLYDCGDSRDGTNYKNVTDSTDPEVLAAKEQLKQILADKPVPKAKDNPDPSKKPKKKKTASS